MNNIYIKQLNEIIIKCVKELGDYETDDLYFELFTDNNETINKYKDIILAFLDNIFDSKNLVVNLDEINKLDINENTYNVIFEYIISNDIKYTDNRVVGSYNVINSYLNDVNNYPIYPKEKQQQLLFKNSKYVLLIRKYKIKLLGQYYNMIDSISKQKEFSMYDSNRIKRYEIKLLDDLYMKDDLFNMTDEEIYKFLYNKVKRYCVVRRNSTLKYNHFIDINEITIYNKEKLSEQDKNKILEKIKYLENKRKYLKNDIANHNLKLVISIARRYFKNNNVMSFEDLIQEGNFGLLNAIDKYDPTMGTTFATYATFWIKQAISRALYDKDRTVRLPVHFIERLNKYKRFIEQYNIANGFEPTIEEIMKELELTKEDIYEFNFHKNDVASLNAPVNKSEDEEELGIFIKDENVNVEKEAINKQLNESILKVLDEVDSYKQSIILLRFGIIPKKPLVVIKNKKIIVFTLEPIEKDKLPLFLEEHNFVNELNYYNDGYEIENVLITGSIKTLDEIGKMYGLTRERIRQVEEKTLQHLRNPRIKKQINYLDNY